MLVDGKQKIAHLARFVCPPAFVYFTIVICVSRDCMKTTYIVLGTAASYICLLKRSKKYNRKSLT